MGFRPCSEEPSQALSLGPGGEQKAGRLATPAAREGLLRFATSQIGDDDTRIQALGGLLEAGHTEPTDTLRVSLRGEWREIQMRGFEISDEPKDLAYSPKVMRLMEHGVGALERKDDRAAERAFQRALALEPRNQEALNNLEPSTRGASNTTRPRRCFERRSRSIRSMLSHAAT